LEKKFWEELCRCLAREDLIDDLMAPLPRQTEIIQELQTIFLQQDREEWLAILGRHDICFSPVNSLSEALADPQVLHRALWFQASHPIGGEIPQQGFPVKFSDNQPELRIPPPMLGEHTREIMISLGYDDSSIQELREKGVV
jgi:crotonobetainyl-CoA:carnitine CoA-transferase CaiB-like acyl-CoA transferase